MAIRTGVDEKAPGLIDGCVPEKMLLPFFLTSKTVVMVGGVSQKADTDTKVIVLRGTRRIVPVVAVTLPWYPAYMQLKPLILAATALARALICATKLMLTPGRY